MKGKISRILKGIHNTLYACLLLCDTGVINDSPHRGSLIGELYDLNKARDLLCELFV